MNARACLATGLLALTLATPGTSRASSANDSGPHPTPLEITVHVEITPAAGSLGQRLSYRAEVGGGVRGRVRFFAPEQGGALQWGQLHVRPKFASNGPSRPNDPRSVGPSAWLGFNGGNPALATIDLQVFALGDVNVPGLEFEVDDGTGPRRARVPVSTVTIVPVIAANDTSADFRGLRGPLAAPWWERVPWLIVSGAALVLAALVIGIVWLVRRRRRPVPVPAPPARVIDPIADALRDLASLRRLGLPSQGRFAEHAFLLTRIARRFLEVTAGRARPGDTTPELIDHLQQAAVEPAELTRLEGLLRYWDRVKFARATTTEEESARAEESVEAFIRRGSSHAGGRAA